jgi:4-hydroxybenzoate polyprenyltransferase
MTINAVPNSSPISPNKAEVLRIPDMLKLIRPGNLLIIALLQSLALNRLGDYDYLLYNIPKTLALLLGTSCIASAGYIINDYFDVKIDLVNKPERVVVGNRLSRRWAIILHISLTALGLFLAWRVNIHTLGIAFLCAVILYVYSSSLKKKFLTGNLSIALLAALSVIICRAYIPELSTIKVIAYSFFAAITTLIREIVKDVEDEKGDALFLSNTLAISFGLRRTKRVLSFASVCLLAAVLIYPLIVHALPEAEPAFFRVYTLFLYLGVAAPVVFFLVRLRKADKQADFAQLSGLMKRIMLIGVFSILLS